MTRSQHDVQKTDPRLLTGFLRREELTPGWTKEDLAAMLKHQLAAPIDADLRSITGNLAQSQTDPAIRTFGNLFAHTAPPLSLLELTKEFAKQHIDQPDGTLPREIATVLYYVSILLALMRHGQRITTLDDAAIRLGVEWLLKQPWLDASLAELCRKGLKLLA